MGKKEIDLSKINGKNPIIQKIFTMVMRKAAIADTKNLRPMETKKVKSKRIKIPMSDGVKLSAFMTRPKEKKPYPVILVRSPYEINKFVYEGILPVMSKYGYVTVLVEVRVSQTSEGEWLPFENEMRDGKDVLDWIAAQEWCDGNIGCFGGSYLGHVQWAMANANHPALKTLCIQVYGPTPYDTFWRRGMFRQDIWSVWATQMMGDHRFKVALPGEQLKEGMQYRPQNRIGEHFIGEHLDWYSNWIHNGKQTDAYWAEGFWGEFYKTAEEASVPMLIEGGWNDIFLRPELEAFRRMPESIRKKSRVLIGPWDHRGNANGDLTYPNSNDDVYFIKNGIEWFDYMLKGKPYPHKLGTVAAYNIGGDGYVEYEGDIAATGKKELYLAADGRLAEEKGAAGSISYEYDPENVPTNLWGNILGDSSVPLCGGPRKQRAIGERTDEISFVSSPVPSDTDIAGAIEVQLYVASDAPATAFSVTVCEVFENGDAYNITSDITDIRYPDEKEYREYEPGERRKLHLIMTDVTWRIKGGSRIRVDIASSNYPAYHIHPNTTENWADTTTSAKARQTVFYGENQASKIVMPVK